MRNDFVSWNEEVVITMSIEEKYIKQDQVNLLVYGPDRPYFKQKQKIYFNLLFLLSEKKKKI